MTEEAGDGFVEYLRAEPRGAGEARLGSHFLAYQAGRADERSQAGHVTLGPCEVCWTSSWEPVESEADCAAAHPHRADLGSGHVRCGYCALERGAAERERRLVTALTRLLAKCDQCGAVATHWKYTRGEEYPRCEAHPHEPWWNVHRYDHDDEVFARAALGDADGTYWEKPIYGGGDDGGLGPPATAPCCADARLFTTDNGKRMCAACGTVVGRATIVEPEAQDVTEAYDQWYLSVSETPVSAFITGAEWARLGWAARERRLVEALTRLANDAEDATDDDGHCAICGMMEWHVPECAVGPLVEAIDAARELALADGSEPQP